MLSGVWQILTTQDTQDSLGQFALLNFVKLALIEFAGLEKRLDSAFTRVCNVQQGWEAPAVQWSLGVFFVQSSDLLHWHASIQRLLVLNTSTHILPRPAIENAKQENIRKRQTLGFCVQSIWRCLPWPQYVQFLQEHPMIRRKASLPLLRPWWPSLLQRQGSYPSRSVKLSNLSRLNGMRCRIRCWVRRLETRWEVVTGLLLATSHSRHMSNMEWRFLFSVAARMFAAQVGIYDIWHLVSTGNVDGVDTAGSSFTFACDYYDDSFVSGMIHMNLACLQYLCACLCTCIRVTYQLCRLWAWYAYHMLCISFY